MGDWGRTLLGFKRPPKGRKHFTIIRLSFAINNILPVPNGVRHPMAVDDQAAANYHVSATRRSGEIGIRTIFLIFVS